MQRVGERDNGLLLIDGFAQFAVLAFFAVLEGAGAVDGGMRNHFGEAPCGVVGGSRNAIGVTDVVARERRVGDRVQPGEVVAVVDGLAVGLEVGGDLLGYVGGQVVDRAHQAGVGVVDA